MSEFEIVSLSAFRLEHDWMMEVRWKASVNDTEPQWAARRSYDLDLPDESFSELLMAIAETLYEHAEDLDEAHRQGPRRDFTRGGQVSLPIALTK